ncbi:MAG: DUF2274 domain-containing protein [Sphingobium sp.]|nr:DUF2274 domain-containing protein [Sphingobium sp.]
MKYRPDRTPIKLAITVTPDLHQMLQQYAVCRGLRPKEAITELVPAMLMAFLESDRGFSKARKAAED